MIVAQWIIVVWLVIATIAKLVAALDKDDAATVLGVCLYTAIAVFVLVKAGAFSAILH